MKLSEGGQYSLWTKPDPSRAARMPDRPCVRKDLQVANRRSSRVEQCEYLGLGVERVEGLCLARMPAALFSFPGE